MTNPGPAYDLLGDRAGRLARTLHLDEIDNGINTLPMLWDHEQPLRKSLYHSACALLGWTPREKR